MDSTQVPDDRIGFLYYPAAYPQLPGHPRLDINVYGRKLDAFFATRSAQFLVRSQEHRPSRLTVTHPWNGASRLQLCVGRIWLTDHDSRVVEAFSLGGQVEINGHDSYTTCVVTSSAPIFDLASPNTATMTLVTEFEALLARQRAGWASDDAGFEECMAHVDPFTLFTAGLGSVLEMLEQAPSDRQDERLYQESVQIAHQAIQVLKTAGEWPDPAPSLQVVLRHGLPDKTSPNRS